MYRNHAISYPKLIYRDRYRVVSSIVSYRIVSYLTVYLSYRIVVTLHRIVFDIRRNSQQGRNYDGTVLLDTSHAGFSCRCQPVPRAAPSGHLRPLGFGAAGIKARANAVPTAKRHVWSFLNSAAGLFFGDYFTKENGNSLLNSVAGFICFWDFL